MKHRWMSLLAAALLLGGCSIHIGAPERVNMTLQGVGIGATAAEAKKNALDDVYEHAELQRIEIESMNSVGEMTKGSNGEHSCEVTMQVVGQRVE